MFDSGDGFIGYESNKGSSYWLVKVDQMYPIFRLLSSSREKDCLKEKSLENYNLAIKFFEKCIKLNKNQPQPY